MPSPIPVTRLLPKDIYPSLDTGACSSPLTRHPHGPTLQVPVQRLHGKVAGRLWSSVILWKELRSVVPVGSGGFGSVYKADYLGETVALKKVKKCAKNTLASRQSFWAELNAAHLRHGNVVRVIAATTCVPAEFEDDSSIGTILMEFVGSRNLQQIICGCGEWAAERWLRYAADIAQGLRFLHAHSIAHLDVKPANVLVSAADVCKIADFGCSLKLDDGREASAVSPLLSHVGGTYTHRAPELLKGEGVSTKADVYSFGITLWQLITREQPYADKDRQYVLYAVVAHNLRPSVQDDAAFRSERGRRCGALLSRCWSGEARGRPGAEELLTRLKELGSWVEVSQKDRF
ncbi:proto-oncogene serine/threonine-protein kinase mos [Betta splendens]|uniref:non-specific serine/threonine protein kinase n=1 Tax=Betta splendens TaxID=158456 RepID=A0A6P7MCN0_BETSP|nr:proto-oncogene serine/threonine-protein kinase mos [Betta splendens]